MRAGRPFILACNDDGIASPGLRAAVAAVLGLGRVAVVAPRVQRTGAGRSLCHGRGQRLSPRAYRAGGRRVEAWQADASPALLVKHALSTLFIGRRPDLLVCGINYGENLGSIVTASGTVGAALEAGANGVPALAVSRQTELGLHRSYAALDWDAAAHFTALFARLLLRRRLPPDVHALNVNVPLSATRRTPWRMTRLSRQSYFSYDVPEGRLRPAFDSVRVGIKVDHAGLEPDSDIHAVAHEAVAVTPLSFDLTSRVSLASLSRLLRF